MENLSKNITPSVLSHHGEFAPIQIIKAAGGVPLFKIMENYFNIYTDPNFKNTNYRFPDEIFKDIKGYEGMYQISNVGRVMSLPRKRWKGNGDANVKGRIVCHMIGKKGSFYYTVFLWKNNKSKSFYVHRLVATAFCGGELDEQVNHKDGIKSHNFASNLEWKFHRTKEI